MIQASARLEAAALVAALCAGADPAGATEVWAHGDAALALSGTLRQLGLYAQQTSADDFAARIAADIAMMNTTCIRAAEFEDCPAFLVVGEQHVGQSRTRVRLRADMRAATWLRAVVVYDNEIAAGVVDTLEGSLGAGVGGDTFFGAEDVIRQGEHYIWAHRLYRGFVALETERLEVSVGRQRVAWGVGRLWTPIDRFSALPPLTLDPSTTPGIDSVDARWNFDGFNYLQLVYAPGTSRDEARWAARLHGVLFDADLSLVGGVFERAPTVGVDFARNVGDAALRFEVVWTDPDLEVWKIDAAAPAPLSAYWQVVVSFDINIDVGTGLYVLAEYLYNGNALGFGSGLAGTFLPLFEATDIPPDPALGVVPGPYATPASAAIFGSSRVITNAAHQAGLQLGYDLTPELRGDLVTLVDMSAGSAVFFPNLAYSPIDSLELTFGAQLFAGPRLSQYGPQKPIVFFIGEWFF